MYTLKITTVNDGLVQFIFYQLNFFFIFYYNTILIWHWSKGIYVQIIIIIIQFALYILFIYGHGSTRLNLWKIIVRQLSNWWITVRMIGKTPHASNKSHFCFLYIQNFFIDRYKTFIIELNALTAPQPISSEKDAAHAYTLL